MSPTAGACTGLSASIPDDERLITIEDAAESRLAKPHVVSLEGLMYLGVRAVELRVSACPSRAGLRLHVGQARVVVGHLP